MDNLNVVAGLLYIFVMQQKGTGQRQPTKMHQNVQISTFNVNNLWVSHTKELQTLSRPLT